MGPALPPRTADRRFLYWGVFFVAFGAITLAAQARLIDQAPVVDALRLWPVVVVALVLAILVRHTSYSLPAWLAMASLSGLAVGGVIATGPRVALDCTAGARPVLQSEQGAFDGPATVDVKSGCGTLAVSTVPGSSWRLDSGDAGRATATVSSTSTGLRVDAGTTDEWDVGASSRETWRLALPTSRIEQLRLALSAGEGVVDLAGADIGSLAISGDATELRVDLSQARLATLAASMRLGGLSLSLPHTDLALTLDVTIGQIDVCVPADVGLHVQRTGIVGEVKYEGFEQHAVEWQSPGYAQAPLHVDVTIRPGLGGVEFNPIHGCRA